MGFRWLVGMALAAVVANSCGSAAPTSPTSPPTAGPHTFPRFIMIMEGHAVPEELTIAVGERVSFMNHDRTTYTIAGGREPSTPDCAEVSVVGVLASGHTRDTEPFTAAKTCDFHVSRDQSALLTGRIVIR
jgi:plastocyanin